MTRLFKAIDFFVHYNLNNSEPPSLFKELVKKSTYPKRLKFYALLHFALSENDLDSQAYHDWMRFVDNLAKNTEIDSPERLSNAIQSLMRFDKIALSDIYTYIEQNFTSEDIFIKETSFFNEYQRREEWLKIQLIQQHRNNPTPNDNWEKAILKAEQHPYYNTQVRFLLDYSKQDDGTYYLSAFNTYFEKSITIFDSKENNGLILDSNYLFSRALFTFGGYERYDSWRYRSFYNQGNKESWRRLLASSDKSVWVKVLLDEVNLNNTQESLQSIIDNFNDKDNWLYAIIKYPELIKRRGRVNLQESMIRLLNSNGLTENCITINPFLYVLHKELEHIPAIKSTRVDGVKAKSWLPFLKITLQDKTKLVITSKHSFNRHTWYFAIKHKKNVIAQGQISTIEQAIDFLSSLDKVKAAIEALKEDVLG